MLLLILNKMNDTYYILFTCSENNDIKINLMLTSLSNQIEEYTTTAADEQKKTIKILVCKDHIETHIKKNIIKRN